MQVTVVVPTYDRGPGLRDTIAALLCNELPRGTIAEVIVVDDGSLIPAQQALGPIEGTPPFELRFIRQSNAGPAAARNTGFREALGDIVVFVDDDIIVPPTLIRDHIQAHLAHPGSVIFGRCPFVEPSEMTPAFRFVNSLGYDSGPSSTEQFLRVEILASGQISCERWLFDSKDGVYRDDLATPAAEEYELSYRLRESGIPIYQATHIVALHDSPVEIESLCRQQYKHAIGCAEVAAKYPATLALADLSRVIHVNANGHHNSTAGTLKRSIKKALSGERLRRALLRTVSALEHGPINYALLATLYRAVMSLHFFAGVNDGMRRFGSSETG